MPSPNGISLSVIVPTQGRETLRTMMQHTARLLHSGDELLVIEDTHGAKGGANPMVAAMVRLCYPLGSGEVRHFKHDAGRNAWGHPQINVGMGIANGDWLVFIDDDDVFSKDGLDVLHRSLSAAPRAPHMFRFESPLGTLWDAQALIEGRVGGHCIVAPNVAEKLGEWSDRYEGDFDFICSTIDKWGGEIIWREEIISRARCLRN